MKAHLRNCLLGWTLAALPWGLWAQQVSDPAPVERGIPLLTSFGSKQTGGLEQNWAVVQDHRGILYVANSGGILEYDGRTWRLIRLPGLKGSQCLTVDAEGNIFVGSVGEFGVLRPNVQGQMGYVSLVQLVPEAERDFGNVRKCFATGDGVFFQTATHLFRYSSAKNPPIRVWRAKTEFDISFNAYDRFFVRQADLGLMEVVGDSLMLPPFGPQFAQVRIHGLLPWPGDTIKRPILIVTRDRGLFRLDDGLSLRQLDFAAAPLLGRDNVYHATILSRASRLLAFATLKNGVYITNLDGNVRWQFNAGVVKGQSKRGGGLPDNSVHYVFTDHQGGLWVAMNKGLARIEVPSPVTVYNEDLNLQGAVETITRHQGVLFIGTTAGLYQLEPGWPSGHIVRTSIQAQVKSLLSTPAGLLVGTVSEGLFLLRRQSSAPEQVATYRVNRMIRSKTDSSVVYLGLANGIASLKYSSNRFVDEGQVPEISVDVRTMAETPEGQVYLTGDAGEFIRITRVPEGRLLVLPVEETPWPDETARAALFSTRQATFVTSLDGLYQHSSDQQGFVRATELGPSPVSDSLVALEIHDYRDRGDLWIRGFENYYFGFREPGGRTRMEPVPILNRVKSDVDNALYIDQNGPNAGIIWLGGFGGLVRFDPEVNASARLTRPFTAYIRSVRQQLGETLDSVLFGGAFFLADSGRIATAQAESNIIELDYGYGNLLVEFAANNFDGADLTEFQTILDNNDSRWSNWTTNNTRDFSNLREGTYTFRVRARNRYGLLSQEASYTFIVNPPFYRTTLAYVLYVLGLALAIYGFITYRERQLVKEKRVLEEKVAERTHELSEQKKVVEEANEEITRQHEQLSEAYHVIEEKNKDITDSITYARRIQEALLPVHDELRRLLPSTFVLNRPRDIVSGDFYWIGEQKDPQGRQCIVLAVVDCTGHGVPGAFMSIMGSTLLNQIVNEGHLLDPSAILVEMDARVRLLLRQDESSASSKDGMDLALCVIYPQERLLRFAGGRRPLFWVRNGELTEIQGRKYGIGGRPQEDPFETHDIQYGANDMIYLSTDGYADQFGGPNRRKFMVNRFKDLVVEVAPQDPAAQLDRLQTEHLSWKGELDQVDDILVVGVRL